MARICVRCFFHVIIYSCQSRFLALCAKTDFRRTYHVCTTIHFVCLLACLLACLGRGLFVFLPTTGHGMVAVGSIGSGSRVIGFSIA